jgi:hypothetical protein
MAFIAVDATQLPVAAHGFRTAKLLSEVFEHFGQPALWLKQDVKTHAAEDTRFRLA